jgi:hypothetical protein
VSAVITDARPERSVPMPENIAAISSDALGGIVPQPGGPQHNPTCADGNAAKLKIRARMQKTLAAVK